jgi:hypothetical protein
MNETGTLMKDFDLVVLTHDLDPHQLCKGDVGTIVQTYGDDAFEVEFVRADGKTQAVVTLTASDVRLQASNEILHVRPLDLVAA